MNDRRDAAYKYQKLANTKMPIVLDMINQKDNAQTLYSSWPDRFYVILNTRIVYKGGVGPDGYRPNEVEAWLNSFFASKSRTMSKL